MKMPSPVREPRASIRKSSFRRLAHHQVASAVTTLADFGVMVCLVQIANASPHVATSVAAFVGAVINFTMGRRWIFAARDGAAHSQAVRYAAVSLASLALNAFGVFVLNGQVGVHYVLARALVATIVSVAWNYPMHLRFVFARVESVAP